MFGNVQNSSSINQFFSSANFFQWLKFFGCKIIENTNAYFFFFFRLSGKTLGIISSQHHHQLIHQSTRWWGILDGQSGCIRKSPRDGLATYRVLCTASMSSRRRISVDPMPFLEQRIMFGICPLFLMASSARCSSMFSVIRKTELFYIESITLYVTLQQ